MKKIITLSAVILVIAILVTSFASCNGKKEDDISTTATTENAQSSIEVFTAEIKENEAVIKNGNKVIQTLSYPINFGHEFDLDYAKKHYAFIDMNFDGELDFYIAVNSKDGVVSYYCWIYNATPDAYEFSALMSTLKNLSVDAEKQLILSKTVKDGVTNIVSYHWVDGELVIKETYSDKNAEIPEEITKVVEENAIGTDKTTTEKSEKEETTKKNNSGSSDNKTTTKVNKPANTTTTAPNEDKIVLETGDLNADGWF
jgi:hypothetical protein